MFCKFVKATRMNLSGTIIRKTKIVIFRPIVLLNENKQQSVWSISNREDIMLRKLHKLPPPLRRCGLNYSVAVCPGRLSI